jgi:hypothetical protein
MRAIIAYFLLLVAVLGQTVDRYPYPIPKPLTGDTPTNGIRLQFHITPSAYDQQYPAVWDTDVGGGLQSRTNQTDRLNTRWIRLGAIVYDQTDRTYYGADFVTNAPMTYENIKAWRPLFTMDSSLVNDISIYSTNGTLLGERTVSLGNHSLSFDGPGGFNVNSGSMVLDGGGEADIYGNLLSLVGRAELDIRTPGVLNHNVSNTWVLTLVNTNTGQVEFQPVPVSIISTNTNSISPDINIYKDNGFLTTPRTLRFNGQGLEFTGLNQDGSTYSGGQFSVLYPSVISMFTTNLVLTAKTNMFLATPKVKNSPGTLQVGNVLTLQNTSSGLVEFSPIPPDIDTSIYKNDGSLTTNRNFELGPFTLNIGQDFDIDSKVNLFASTLNFASFSNLTIKTPALNGGGGTFPSVGWPLTLMDTSGKVEFRPPAGSFNIYNTNGTLTGDRTLLGNGNRFLKFQALTNMEINAATVDLIVTPPGAGRLALKTPNVAGANSNHVLTLLNPSTGASEWVPPQNIYNNDGALTGNRVLDGATHNLKLFNIANFDLWGGTTTLRGTGQLNIQPPGFSSGKDGYVLTLKDPTSGKVEFAAGPSTVNTIYTANDQLTSDRAVNGNGKSLAFTNTTTFRTEATVNSMKGSSAVLINTPNVSSGASSIGQVLTLMDNVKDSTTAGKAEWTTLPAMVNIYNTSSSITSDRTVSGENPSGTFRNLAFSSIKELTLEGRTNLYIRTPKVVNSTASDNQWLKLISAKTGQVEWDTIVPGTTPPPTTIYTGDGSIDPDADNTRTVNQNGNNLAFTATGKAFRVNSAAEINLNVQGTGKMIITTPNVAKDGAAAHANKVLMLASDGSSEFQAVTNAADSSIYLGDGILLSDRNVRGQNLPTDPVRNLSFLTIKDMLLQSQKLKLQPGTTFPIGRSPGQVLTLMDATSGSPDLGLVDFTTINTLYVGNGSLTGPRFVFQSGNALTFSGLNSSDTGSRGTFNVLGQNSVDISSFGPLVLRVDPAAGSLQIRTPLVTSKAVNNVLTLKDPSTGRVEFEAPGVVSAVTLYSQDSTVADDTDHIRTVSILNGNGVTFQGSPNANVSFSLGAGSFVADTTGSATVGGGAGAILKTGSGGNLKIQTPKVSQATKPLPGHVLTYQSFNDGTVEYEDPFFPHNGSVQSSKTLTGNGNNLTAQGFNALTLSAQTTTIVGQGGGALNIRPPEWSPSTPVNSVLSLIDPSLGKAEWRTIPAVPTIYTLNGDLADNRTVSQRGHVLTFAGNGGTFTVSGSSVVNLFSSGSLSLEAGPPGNKMNIRTPLVIGPAGTRPPNNSVLTLINNATGEVEFGPGGGGSGTDTSIYTRDGSLAEVAGTITRTLSGAGKNLILGSTASKILDFSVNTSQGIALNAAGNANLSGVNATLETVDSTLGKVKIRTPSVLKSTALAGQVLKLTASGSDGTVEFGAAPVGGAAGLYSGGLARVLPDTFEVVPPDTVATVVDNFQITDLSPGWNTDASVPYIYGMRVTAMVCSTPAGGAACSDTMYKNRGNKVNIRLGNGPVTSVYVSSGGRLFANAIASYVILDMVYTKGIGIDPTNPTGPRKDGFLMVNAAFRSTSWGPPLEGATQAATPRAAGGQPAVADEMLTLQSDGSSEFQGAAAVPGLTPNMYVATSVTMEEFDHLRGCVKVTVLSTTPPYTHTTGGTYPIGMRITVPLNCAGCELISNGNINCDLIQIGSGPEWQLIAPDGDALLPGTIVGGSTLDLVFARSKHGILPPGNPYWMVNNTGPLSTATPIPMPGMGRGATSRAPIPIRQAAATKPHAALVSTNAATSRVTTVGFAGVVDVYADLSEAPLDFKKISTLGFYQVGDGRHADYYLTAYDQGVTNAMRSLLDPTKMWKRLR